jgi:hypothetical protein
MAASVTAFKKKASPVININDVLKGARKPDGPAKSKVAVIDASKELQTLASEVRTLKDEVDSSTALYEAKSAELIATVTPAWESLCASGGYQSSLKVPTPDGVFVGVTFSSNWLKISPDVEDKIAEIVGDDEYGRYFNTVNVIKVKGDLANDRLADLIERVGAEDFANFFEVESVIKPTENFKTEQFRLAPEVRSRLRDEAGVRPYKPSIRVR